MIPDPINPQQDSSLSSSIIYDNSRINEYAYVAGVIDAKGQFCFRSSQPRLVVRAIERPLADLLKRLGGGIVYKYTRQRELYTWRLRMEESIDFFNALLPFLRVKENDLINALARRHDDTTTKTLRSRFG